MPKTGQVVSDDDFEYLNAAGEVIARPAPAATTKDDAHLESVPAADLPPPASPSLAAPSGDSPISILSTTISPVSELGVEQAVTATDESEVPLQDLLHSEFLEGELNPEEGVSSMSSSSSVLIKSYFAEEDAANGINPATFPADASRVAIKPKSLSDKEEEETCPTVDISRLIASIRWDEPNDSEIKPIISPDGSKPQLDPLEESEPTVVGVQPIGEMDIAAATHAAATSTPTITTIGLAKAPAPEISTPSIMPATYSTEWSQHSTLSHSSDSNGELRCRRRSPTAERGTRSVTGASLKSQDDFATIACNIVKKLFCCFYSADVHPNRQSMQEALLSECVDAKKPLTRRNLRSYTAQAKP